MERRERGHGLRLFVGAVLALWTLDVLVNLGLLPGLLSAGFLSGRPRDFAGLLIGSAQVAAAAVLLALAAAAAISVTASTRSVRSESVAMLGALLSALEVLAQARISWGLAGSQLLRAALFAAAAGLVVWFGLRFLSGLATVGRWTLSEIVRFTLFPPLVVGYADLGLFHASRGRFVFALVFFAIAALWLGAARILPRLRGRAGFVRWLPIALACLAAVWSWIPPQPERSRDTIDRVSGGTGPDIVLIVLDTVRADRLKAYGHERDTMPQLERWAETAFVAARAVSPAGWTSPAHASILSGLPVSLHGVHYGERAFVTSPLDGIRWLPEELGALGYRSLAVTANPLAIPDGVGEFDEVLAPSRNAWHASTIAALVDHRSPLLRSISERLRWRTPYVDARGIAELVRRSVPEGPAPLFLFVNFMDAHSPYNPSAAALESLGVQPGHTFDRYRSHRELTRMWSTLPPSAETELGALYDAELRGLDTELASLLSWIGKRFGDEAVVIVTSDHGEELGEDGRVGHEYGLEQRLLHVPLWIRGPGFAPGAAEGVADLRRLHDVVLSLARGEEPDPSPLYDPDEFGVIAERYPSGHAAGPRRAWISLIDGDRKATGPSTDKFHLLDLRGRGFDRPVPLDGDPGRDLRERIDSYWERHRDRRNDDAALTEEERARLRSLGYVR